MMRYYNLLRNISNWPLYLAVKFGLKHADTLLFTTRRGVRIAVPMKLLQTFKEIFMDECYLSGLGCSVPENPVVLDIGANAGYFPLFALSRFDEARVFAFEPIQTNFRLLERNRDLNPDRLLVCLLKAVAGASGELMLAYDALEAFLRAAGFVTRQRPVDMLWAWKEEKAGG